MATAAEKVEQLKRMKRRPATPGELLADQLEALGMNQGEAAARLKVGRQTVNEVINGRRSLTADMAHRLGRLFGSGPEIWLLLQAQLDLWDALHMDTLPYQVIEPIARVEE